MGLGFPGRPAVKVERDAERSGLLANYGSVGGLGG